MPCVSKRVGRGFGWPLGPRLGWRLAVGLAASHIGIERIKLDEVERGRRSFLVATSGTKDVRGGKGGKGGEGGCGWGGCVWGGGLKISMQLN